MMNSYENPEYLGIDELRAAIAANRVECLAPMIVAAALYEEDFDSVYEACLVLSAHPDETIRGNAILGFGHLARLFERTGEEAPKIVLSATKDPSEYVRGQAFAAASDLEHFLGLQVVDGDDT